MARIFAFLGILTGIWIMINIIIPVFGLSTGAIWSMDGMKPLAEPVKTAWNGTGSAITKFVGAPSALPAPAPTPTGSVTRVILVKEYPEIDAADGCTYWVKAMSDGTFPKTLVSCPASSPAPAPAAPVAARVAPAPAPAPALVATTLCNSQKEQHPAVTGQGWTPSGSWRIVNFWTNEAGHPQGERKLLLAPGQNPTLMGGGTSWSWGPGCESVVRGEYASNGLPAVDLGQLQAEGLAR